MNSIRWKIRNQKTGEVHVTGHPTNRHQAEGLKEYINHVSGLRLKGYRK